MFMRSAVVFILSLASRAYIEDIGSHRPSTDYRSSIMKLRRQPLLAALAVCAAVAGLALLDVAVTVDLDRPFIATR
jgi:hypothetical protein